MPSLRELDGRFIRREKAIADESHGKLRLDGTIQWGGFEIDVMRTVETLAEAHGLWIGCPKCFHANGDSLIGTHYLTVYFPNRGVPNDVGLNKKGQPVRWSIVGGTTLDDLQLAPSILLEDGCAWHGFVGSSGVPPGHAA